MYSDTLTALAVLWLVVLVAGCLGGAPDEAAQAVNNSMDSEVTETADGRGDDDRTRYSAYTASGLPEVRGIGDGASVSLGDRVLWLNATNRSVHRTSDDAILIELTVEPERDRTVRPKATTLVQHLLHSDHPIRLEPYPSHVTEIDPEEANALRRYLADALVYRQGGETLNQSVFIETDGELRLVSLGGTWTGGPVVDPWDPPHTLTSDSPMGSDVEVSIRRNGSQVFTGTMSLEGYDDDVYRFERPGDYTVVLETEDGDVHTTSFTVPLSAVADCRYSWRELHLENDSLTSMVDTVIQWCGDPGDRPYGITPPAMR